ncbi:hypothetical protein PI124_g9001 [Phytophthora idaei]|nr:hypothetical protein PI125_g9749 [Phytophthora idaei]KAG3155916.1 hypothetical protein PI126_g8980 [Phytophthora idaei]KAG3246270.1 hypothetical protein PI124_g9001 [Phytophthora idaei]
MATAMAATSSAGTTAGCGGGGPLRPPLPVITASRLGSFDSRRWRVAVGAARRFVYLSVAPCREAAGGGSRVNSSSSSTSMNKGDSFSSLDW